MVFCSNDKKNAISVAEVKRKAEIYLKSKFLHAMQHVRKNSSRVCTQHRISFFKNERKQENMLYV